MMDNSEIYVGLDIGTTSIKVIIAEHVKGQANIIGYGNTKSAGLNRGVIVDIDQVVATIRDAVNQAEKKANLDISEVTVGIPANLLQIEKCHGMVSVRDENGNSQEITKNDVYKVTQAALVQNLPPERDVIDIIQDEFIVDGFDGIKDPRGMMGVRMEMHAVMYTGPKTILHNIKKCIQKAGLKVKATVVAPLATARLAMSDAEQDFGSILIDMGGGQTTAAVIHDHKLKYTYVDQEGGDYVTRDISVARMRQVFEKINRSLNDVNAFQLPGGIILTGGMAALPGIRELAEEIFGVSVKIYIPQEMNLRFPSFSQVIGLVNYVTKMSDIERLVKGSLEGNTIDITADTIPYADSMISNNFDTTAVSNDYVDDYVETADVEPQDLQETQPKHKQNKKKNGILSKAKNFMESFFD